MKLEIEVEEDSADLQLGELEDVLGFHLRMANVAIFHDYQNAMSGITLTPKQFAVLELIEANAGVSQIELAKTLRMDKATMMALVNRLQDRQYIERRPSLRDGRRRDLTITSAGMELLKTAQARRKMHELRFTSRFSEEELELFLKYLKRISTDPAPR